MKRIKKVTLAVLVFLFGANAAASAAGNVISFQNDTCVAVHLEAEGNNACFGYGGCSLDIAPHGSKQVSLRPGVRPKWAQITVSGSCETQKLSMNGQCAVDLEQVFRESGYLRDSAPGESLRDAQPIFEEITGPFDQGVSFATVKLNVGLCELVDGVDHCDVRCSVD
jgi:hypothetical protein